jgi:hypothetical protein
MVSKEDWGLKKDGIRNPKQKSGFTICLKFSTRRSSYCFETEFRRDERVMRFNCKS